MRTKSFLPFILCAACEAPPPSPGTESQQIINGDPLSNAQAALSGAVTIENRADNSVGNGVLIGAKAILTANHVLKHVVGAELVNTPPEQIFVMSPPSQELFALDGQPVRFPGVERKDANGQPTTIPLDLAVAKLKFGLAPPAGPFPRVAKDDSLLGTVLCISTMVHEVVDAENAVPNDGRGPINKAIFKLELTKSDEYKIGKRSRPCGGVFLTTRS